MALRPHLQVLATDINWIVTAAAERGGILSAASGNVASYVTSVVASGTVPIGILMEDIESMNYMNHPQYLQRRVSDLGSKVGIMTEGECVTNFVDGFAKPHISAGKQAFLTHSGLVTVRDYAPGVEGSAGGSGVGIKVGRFLSNVDSDGFVKLWVSL